MARPNIQGPKAVAWLLGRYEAQKAEIKELRKESERFRLLAQRLGEALQVIRSDVSITIERADPHTPHWRKRS